MRVQFSLGRDSRSHPAAASISLRASSVEEFQIICEDAGGRAVSMELLEEPASDAAAGSAEIVALPGDYHGAGLAAVCSADALGYSGAAGQVVPPAASRH